MKKFSIIILILLSSCKALDNNHFDDKKFRQILIKENWITFLSLNINFSTLELTNFKAYPKADLIPSYGLVKFNKNGTLTYQYIINKNCRTLQRTDELTIADSFWYVKDKKLFIKANVTSLIYNTKESSYYSYIESVENVYNINIRKTEPYNEMWISFPFDRNLSKSYIKQDLKKI